MCFVLSSFCFEPDQKIILKNKIQIQVLLIEVPDGFDSQTVIPAVPVQAQSLEIDIVENASKEDLGIKHQETDRSPVEMLILKF